MPNGARILLYDLEVTPILGWTYGIWDTRVIRTERDSHLMCFAYKWLGEDETHVVSLPDFPRYTRDKYNDKDVVAALHALFDEADIVVAHNANKFDNKISMGRFLYHGFPPPSPVKTVDTLTSAKRYFKCSQYTLDALCKMLNIGCKSAVTHAALWRRCLDGDMDAWSAMAEYNINDIEMLEGLYLKLRPYISNHPNLSMFDKASACPKCGSDKLQYRGLQRSSVATYRRVQCQECGAWSRERQADKDTESPKITNIT